MLVKCKEMGETFHICCFLPHLGESMTLHLRFSVFKRISLSRSKQLPAGGFQSFS